MLVDRLNEDMKAAMKARDSLRLGVLRMTLSELKNARIQKQDDLTEDDAVQVVKKAIKSRLESAEQYRLGNREDLATKEQAEAETLSVYVPEQISGDALREAVKAAIAETGAASMKDMGKVMKTVIGAHGSQVDGREVQALVKELLG